MTGAKGAVKGGGWMSMGTAGTAKLVWGSIGAAATAPGTGTIPVAGSTGRE